jgi:hypothetical protein
MTPAAMAARDGPCGGKHRKMHLLGFGPVAVCHSLGVAPALHDHWRPLYLRVGAAIYRVAMILRGDDLRRNCHCTWPHLARGYKGAGCLALEKPCPREFQTARRQRAAAEVRAGECSILLRWTSSPADHYKVDRAMTCLL